MASLRPEVVHHMEEGGVRLADAAAPETRSLVPWLKLGATRDEDYLMGNKCQKCGVLYLGPRQYCGACSSEGPFNEVKLGRSGAIHVWSIIHQAPAYANPPYATAIVDLDDGVCVNTNLAVEAKPENIDFGMRVKMVTEKVSEDREGNAYVAYKFMPA
ncbi:MAG: Zn-ribbon domain-containing OB-fold protein [Dehalococcoidia bacterium]